MGCRLTLQFRQQRLANPVDGLPRSASGHRRHVDACVEDSFHEDGVNRRTEGDAQAAVDGAAQAAVVGPTSGLWCDGARPQGQLTAHTAGDS